MRKRQGALGLILHGKLEKWGRFTRRESEKRYGICGKAT